MTVLWPGISARKYEYIFQIDLKQLKFFRIPKEKTWLTILTIRQIMGMLLNCKSEINSTLVSEQHLPLRHPQGLLRCYIFFLYKTLFYLRQIFFICFLTSSLAVLLWLCDSLLARCDTKPKLGRSCEVLVSVYRSDSPFRKIDKKNTLIYFRRS